jgi:putative ABC transport system permease protein
MIRHNLLLIYRNFKRFKSVFFINLIGLSTGLACVLLIYLWVTDELAVDKFHAAGDRLYWVMEHRQKADGIWTSPTTSGPTRDALIAEMPEIEYAATTTWVGPLTISLGEEIFQAQGTYAGKDYFKMFSFELLHGNADQVLKEKNSVVISESLANKLFKTSDNIIGKAIRLEHSRDLQVTGVFKDIPNSSTVKFDFVSDWDSFAENKRYLQTFNNTSCFTMVVLKPGTDLEGFNVKIADFVKRQTNNGVTHRTLFLKKFNEIYLHGNYENGVITGGRIAYIKLFSIIAVFILVIACINFMNLSTAKASRRIKEVGIKKAIGANRRALIWQYLGESMLMSLLSLALAILMVDLLLPQFNLITGKQLDLTLEPRLLLSVGVITILTGVIAGSYPAFYLSGFSPAAVLKGKFNSSLGELWARKGLVVIQFALSIMFIVSVIVVYRQVEYVQSKNLGYDRENIVYVEREGGAWEPEKLEAYLSELKQAPGVIDASSTSHNMVGHNGGTYGVVWPGKDPANNTEFESVTVNFGMIELWGMKMKEGRAYSRDFYPDTARIVFTEAAIKFMGLEDPIGKKVTLWGQEVEIIGVVKDFHYESLHETYKPVFFRLAPEDTGFIVVRLEPGKEEEALSNVKALFNKFSPGFLFSYQFLDERYKTQYVAEQRVATLSKYFAGLAILISCLGLFGLASFTAERRLKEIGIRKVMGSSEFRIVYLLSADFTRIVLIANLIALPMSYFLVKYWLDGFAFKIGLEWWYFAVAGSMALLIAWITVGSQAYKAARVNPTKCLKDE